MKHLPLLALALIPLSACDRDQASYPKLLPTNEILADPQLPDHATTAANSPAAVDAETTARAEALRRRAAALQAPVIEPDTRSRMQPTQ
ncbi:hypothetical protein JJJ17_15145 [Paracoccus caeni]|uniref:DUF3035 domain-containing protein n=1 Tax=Paracoccus caeni TaxID=657651 RepID=A0A934SE97_9RHOB|nr:hypothetical protein [Paracoccus caeni]MBK4217265.1 hypothetical protein [Paracoccus caeni]